MILKPKGRGAAGNPKGRFERLAFEPELDDVLAEERVPPQTEHLRMASKSVLTRNNSPDVGFDVSVNPYAGCSHGWTYFHFLHSSYRWLKWGKDALKP